MPLPRTARTRRAAPSVTVQQDAKRDDLERRRGDAHRPLELAIAEANLAPLGSVRYREAMAGVRAASREVDEFEADGRR